MPVYHFVREYTVCTTEEVEADTEDEAWDKSTNFYPDLDSLSFVIEVDSRDIDVEKM